MVPLFLYALFAALLGLCVHKKWYGGMASIIAMLIWMILMQCVMAYMTKLPSFQ